MATPTVQKKRKEHTLAHHPFTKKSSSEYMRSIVKWRFENGPEKIPGCREAMSRAELASRLGVHPQLIHNLESGACQPSFAVMCAIFRVTGLSPFPFPKTRRTQPVAVSTEGQFL